MLDKNKRRNAARTNPQEGIGQRIKKRREFLGLTQEELAEHVGVTKAAVSYWETTNDVNPRLQTFIRLYTVLHCTPQQLAFGEQPRKRKKKTPPA